MASSSVGKSSAIQSESVLISMKYSVIAAFAAFVLIGTHVANAATEPASAFFFKSIISVDRTNHTVTLPLHRGQANGESVWYIVTDASSASVARTDGVDYAPDIAKLGDAAIAKATVRDGIAQFPGAPNFSPRRTYVASATGFPPRSAKPGSVADDAYSPFVRIDGTAGVLNAPIVATGDGPFDVTTHSNTEDRVVAIDITNRTVTLVLARGFVDAKPIFYLSTEASDPVAASVERATYVPRLAKAESAAAIPIGVIANGPQAGSEAQGLAYLALKTPLTSDATEANAANIGSPFNVLSLAPDISNPYAENGYSPLWSVFVVGERQTRRLTSYADVAPIAKPAGFVVNCPAIAFDVGGGP
jgi:hypothetical protein